MKTEIFNYQDQSIGFKTTGNGIMVNATEMAKPFGKRAVEWLRLDQTNEFLQALKQSRTEVQILTSADLVQVKKGGNTEQGTWMHEDVALEFARWLNPAFSIWCNDRIKELLKHGFTATDAKIDELVANPDLLIELANNLKKERAEKIILDEKLQRANKTIIEQAPKVKYTDEVLQSQSDHNTTTIAKECGMSSIALNKILCSKKVQYKQSGSYVLYSKYQDKGYTKTRTHTFTDGQGNQRTEILMTWTEKGRMFIHNLLQ